MRNVFGTTKGIVVAGFLIGFVAVLLQYFGNPPNMGFCIACFERDIAGALGFHNAKVVQYVRPEIIFIILGSMVASLFTKEFKPRGGSSPIVRFFLGIFAMIGALVFLGCPWRAFIRLAGGDLNAIFGILGLVVGIAIGAIFLKNGFSLGRAYSQERFSGFIFPVFMLFIFILFVIGFEKINISVKGPGSMHAPIILSVIAGLIVGFLAQRSRFCTVGAIRDLIVIRSNHLLLGILSFTFIIFILNLVLGKFHPGFVGQPIAHTNELWNFLGMVLAGFCFSLAGGCPGRQLVLSGEGDNDAAVFVAGMIIGAGVSHNFALASTPKGIGLFAPIAVCLGLVFCFAVAILNSRRIG